MGERRGPPRAPVHPRVVLRSARSRPAARDPVDRVRRRWPRGAGGPRGRGGPVRRRAPSRRSSGSEDRDRCDAPATTPGAARSAVSRAVSSQLNVAARARPRGAEPLSQRGVRQQALHPRRDVLGRRSGPPAARRPPPSPAAPRRPRSGPVCRRHRFEDREPEPFVERRVHERLRARRATPPSPAPRRTRSRRRDRGPRQEAPRAPAARGPTPPGSTERRVRRSRASAARPPGARRRRGSVRGGSSEARSRRARGGTGPRSRTGVGRAPRRRPAGRKNAVSTPSGTTVRRSARRAARR